MYHRVTRLRRDRCTLSITAPTMSTLNKAAPTAATTRCANDVRAVARTAGLTSPPCLYAAKTVTPGGTAGTLDRGAETLKVARSWPAPVARASAKVAPGRHANITIDTLATSRVILRYY
jgi:hypothetical protein